MPKDPAPNTDYDELSTSLRKLVNRAFRKAVAPQREKSHKPQGRAAKRRKLEKLASAPSDSDGLQTNYRDEDALYGGGFLPDDANDGDNAFGGGGFLPDDGEEDDASDDESDASVGDSYIPFSRIPAALQYLDLPPDDPDVLAVFKNAASGWGASNQGDELGVRLSDWREVCAVLVAGRDEVSGSVDDPNGSDGPDVEAGGYNLEANEDGDANGLEEESGSDNEGDEYREEGEDDDVVPADNSDDEDYGAPSRRITRSGAKSTPTQQRGKTKTKGEKKGPTKRASARRAHSSSASSSDSEQPRMTARQKAEARKAFGLFFPDVIDMQELDRKRIMIKDISRVADLLQEKLKADDIIEMVEAFSTAPDKSIGLGDFENLVMVARLV